MSSLSRLIFWNFSCCCQSKSFYWQNKGFAARSEKSAFHYIQRVGVRSNPPFWSQCTCEMKNDSNSLLAELLLSRNAEQMIGHATCWHKEFCQTRVAIKSSNASRDRGKRCWFISPIGPFLPYFINKTRVWQEIMSLSRYLGFFKKSWFCQFIKGLSIYQGCVKTRYQGFAKKYWVCQYQGFVKIFRVCQDIKGLSRNHGFVKISLVVKTSRLCQ